MTFNRWEWLESMKPESMISATVKYMTRQIAEEILAWPPQVSAMQTHAASRFSKILRPDAPRPALAAYEEALRRARWELERDYDAIDDYERNHRIAEACSAERDQIASEFIQHYILESYFALMEKTDYKIKRKDVLLGVEALGPLIKSMWLVNLAPGS
jgi:hypothetical protein